VRNQNKPRCFNPVKCKEKRCPSYTGLSLSCFQKNSETAKRKGFRVENQTYGFRKTKNFINNAKRGGASGRVTTQLNSGEVAGKEPGHKGKGYWGCHSQPTEGIAPLGKGRRGGGFEVEGFNDEIHVKTN